MKSSMKVPEAPDFTAEQAVVLRAPADVRVPFVFGSPHSGRFYPPRFLALSRLDAYQIRRSEDCLVDHLIEGVVPMGAQMIAAQFPRAYLDVNREPFELDQAMFAGALPDGCNSKSIRVAGGLGTIPRLVGDGFDIYHKKLPIEEALMRIESCYMPYHAQLMAMLERTKEQFGFAVLVDCHSMPSSLQALQRGANVDIVLGDRFGSTMPKSFMLKLGGMFEARGYRVAYNRPYAGGYITEHYGSPMKNMFAVQLEICRSLYLDEANYVANKNFERLKTDIEACFADMMALPDFVFLDGNMAAE